MSQNTMISKWHNHSNSCNNCFIKVETLEVDIYLHLLHQLHIHAYLTWHVAIHPYLFFRLICCLWVWQHHTKTYERDSWLSTGYQLVFTEFTPGFNCRSFSNTNLINVSFNSHRIGKTPVRIILWCPTTKMLIKACFLIQPPEQEGGCQTCCI